MTTPDEQAAEARLRSELAALRELPMPPDVAERIERAVARPTPRKRRPRLLIPLCAAATLVALVFGPTAAGPDTPRPAGRDDELRSTGAVAFGRHGAGPLADPVRRRECLAAVGVPEPGAALLGGVPYTVDGTPGRLLVLGTAVTGRYRLVVVDDACGRLLAHALAGR